MKREKGITLVSIIVYVIGIVVVTTIVSSLLAFYNKNMVDINNSSDVSMEFSKFNAKLIEETSIKDNSITEITTTKITFSSGNVYEFKENKVYCNSIAISNYVSEFQANMEEQETKQVLNIYILHERGDESLVHNQTYVLTINSSNTQNASSKILKAAPEVDINGLAVKNTLIKPYKNSNVQIVIPKGFAPVILNGSNWTTSEPGQDGSVKEIMAPEDWLKITIDDINKGIVIVDHAITYDDGHETGTVPDFNEYVWVPIPESTNFARVAWTTNCGYDASGNWVSNVLVTQPISNGIAENAYWEETETEEYQDMLSSINGNKGFYISRYEASNNGNNAAQSKRGQTAWVSITQSNASISSERNPIYNAHLIYGIEWDSALKWLQRTETKTISELQTNSSTWGNYYDSTAPANVSGAGSGQNTGFSEYWKANNIYDLAGNRYEWTQERWSTGTGYVVRAGGCGDDGDTSPAAHRNESNKTYTGYGLRFPL